MYLVPMTSLIQAPLDLRLVVDPKVPENLPEAVLFGVGEGPYAGPRGLLTLYEHLVMGAPLPLLIALREVRTVASHVAVALFLQRELLVLPGMLPLVLAATYYNQNPVCAIHLDPALLRCFQVLTVQESDLQLPLGTQAERITTATQWIRDYVYDGQLPDIGPKAPLVEVLDTGTNGFVIGRGVDHLPLLQEGYLKGIVVTPLDEGLNQVRVFRKSVLVGFDLVQARSILNEMERMSGTFLPWVLEENCLSTPEGGTDLPIADIVHILLHL